MLIVFSFRCQESRSYLITSLPTYLRSTYVCVANLTNGLSALAQRVGIDHAWELEPC